MSELDGILPERWDRLRALPLFRDQVILLLTAVGLLSLGLETYLAHSISGTLVPREQIPIWFGFASGIVMLIAGFIARRRRNTANIIATFTLVAAMGVGVLGSFYHVARAALPGAAPGERLTLDLLVLAPPIMGPLVFALIGLMGISAAWQETSPDSGELQLPGGQRLRLPYSKTRAYLLMVSMGILATLVSSALDHARSGYGDPWVWLPTVVAVFAMVVSFALAALDKISRADLYGYVVAMLLMLVVGPIGSLLHTDQNLTAAGDIVIERFLRGPPFLAPLLYSNMGLLGLAVLVKPAPSNHAGQIDTSNIK